MADNIQESDFITEGMIYGVGLQSITCCGEPGEDSPNPHFGRIIEAASKSDNLVMSKPYLQSMSMFLHIGYPVAMSMEGERVNEDHDIAPVDVRRYDMQDLYEVLSRRETLLEELHQVGIRDGMNGLKVKSPLPIDPTTPLEIGTLEESLALYEIHPRK